MEDQRKFDLLNQAGQSTVEYILLMVVLMTMGLAFFKSNAFENFFGPNSGVFTAIARKMEFSYRYGHNGIEDTYGENYTSEGHEAYFNNEEGKSRFFAPIQPHNE